MELLNTLVSSHQEKETKSKLMLHIASTQEELIEVQQLRYKVFVEGMGLSALKNQHELDSDIFDQYCDHLIVRDSSTLKIVGTYRVLNPKNRAIVGKFYADQEFDLARLTHMTDYICETGRACVHPDYRGSSVLMMLWGGLLSYMQRHQCQYLIGCASVSLAGGGDQITALYHYFKQKNHLAPAELQVTPRLPFPLRNEDAAIKANIPPLLRGYLLSGAWIAGEPAWDPDFNTADFLILLDLSHITQWFEKRYLK